MREECGNDFTLTLRSLICQMINHIQASRSASIKEKLERNKKNIENYLSQSSAASNFSVVEKSEEENMLSLRMKSGFCKLSRSCQESGEKESFHGQEVLSTAIIFGNNISGKSLIHFIKLPFVEKIPPYTTWIFLDRNERMTDDQSVVGRRQIYYDHNGSEALICSDSEEEIPEVMVVKHEFSEGEDHILRKIIEKYDLNDMLLDILTQYIEATSSEIQERWKILMNKHPEDPKVLKDFCDLQPESTFLEKSLNTSLDSFDNLFCRRCLVFDCRLHGCSQNVIIPNEKQSFWSESIKSCKPCSEQCYLKGKEERQSIHCDRTKSSESQRGSENTTEKDISNHSCSDHNTIHPDNFHENFTYVDIATNTGFVNNQNAGLSKMSDHGNVTIEKTKYSFEKILGQKVKKQRKMMSLNVHEVDKDHQNLVLDSRDVLEGIGVQDDVSWKPLEKELYIKGVEIFGKNSCLIARNLLSGFKTCIEVFNYMLKDRIPTPIGSAAFQTCLEDDGKVDPQYMNQDMSIRSRFWRRRGRTRKLKYTWKSAGHPLIRKRISNGKQQACKQYTPCGCQSICGKQCPCNDNGTCCEKYCGCSRSCKNRFRGCHCAKSQCRSRQCPCFAAARECDPDVCRNCWISCGDGTLGEPPSREDGYQCGNMKLLLKQQQRILLGKSDVAGWGAFVKNSVKKNDYLGEYTGELISHREADKRGKIYDRANSSFLFDLNDQYVLDAYRKGDKLKFANHSSNPNCYAKVMFVAGDHRVGIFAKEYIEASEELFYDYRYGPDQAPKWARKPDSSRKDDSLVSHKRAQKIA